VQDKHAIEKKSGRCQFGVEACLFEIATVVKIVGPYGAFLVPACLFFSECGREFMSALQDTIVKVTSNNLKGLSQICEKLHFRVLVVQLTRFLDYRAVQEVSCFIRG
jgi:hypothetical protein